MRTMIAALIIAALLTACSDGTSTESPDLSLTADAARAVLQGAARQQTATAQAQIRAATAEARATRAAELAGTATAQAYAFQLTATADALVIAERQTQATATVEARQIVAAAERQAATATASALARQEQQAQRDAEIARRQADFFAWFLPLATVAILGLTVWGAWLLYWQMLEARRLRYSVLESRAGTVVFVREGRTTAAQLLLPPGLPAPDYDAPTQAQRVPQEAVSDTILVRTAAGETYVPKIEPQDAQREAVDRRLALWLLRKSIQLNGPQARQLATAKALGWRPESWVKAVALLKPYVDARPGRSGGTFCAEPFGTLAELYSAIGEKRISLGSAATPLPKAGATVRAETFARANRIEA